MSAIPYVKRVDCGLVVKYKLYSHRPEPPRITRLRAEDGSRWYIDPAGYLYPERVSEKKGQNIDSLKRSFSRLRDIINCNATRPDSVLFVTFTYDPKRLRGKLTLKKVSDDMRNSFQRMRRSGLRFQYVYTVEQQGNGNWHCHCLFFFDGPAPFIEQDFLEWVWQAGFVRVSKRFDGAGIRNIGSYVCADLTYGSGTEHGRLKDERLLSYPSGMHLYRCSRGILRPVENDLGYDEYLDDVQRFDEPPFYDVRRSFVLETGSSPLPLHFRYQHFLDTSVL